MDCSSLGRSERVPKSERKDRARSGNRQSAISLNDPTVDDVEGLWLIRRAIVRMRSSHPPALPLVLSHARVA
jgi:hypothetical protein